jgi:hypothetical protein
VTQKFCVALWRLDWDLFATEEGTEPANLGSFTLGFAASHNWRLNFYLPSTRASDAGEWW